MTTSSTIPGATLPDSLEFDRLCLLEPGLRRLQMAMHGVPRSWQAYESFKSQAKRLVGWGAQHPALQSEDAYEFLIRRITAEVAP